MSGAPGTPQNFAVQTANQQILVSWDLSAGATSYIVQRSLDNVIYAPVTTISGSPLDTTYLDVSVTLGTKYWYKVAASSTNGSITFTGQPNNNDTVTIDSVVFTAVSTGAIGTQFNIGSSVAQTITNLANVVNSTIPGVVAASSTATQLQLVAFLTGVPLTSALTNTTVTAFASGGTSNYTHPQAVIPTNWSEMSLAQIRLMSRQRADRVNSNFVTDPEWNSYINLAMYELYDLLIDEYEDYNMATPIQFTTDGSTFLYPLPDGRITFQNGETFQDFTPDPFYKLMGFDLGLQTANNAYVTINKFNFIDRNRFVYPNSASTIYGVFNAQYRVIGNKIMFIPTPSANQTIRMWYIPRLKGLLKDTDASDISISGWIQYVIIRAAKYALDKEESDTSKLDTELVFLKTRIEEAASNRDAGQPDTISNTRAGGFGWGQGGGMGYNGSSGGF